MKHSAGILLYRKAQGKLEFLLVHPGGPFWAGKDEHAWSIPKGEIEEEEKIDKKGKSEKLKYTLRELEAAARRELKEETGLQYDGELIPLPVLKTSGKVIYPFLGEGDFDPAFLKSNFFEMEWPAKSGHMESFPEVDKAAWFDAVACEQKLHKGQVPVIDIARRVLLMQEKE